MRADLGAWSGQGNAVEVCQVSKDCVLSLSLFEPSVWFSCSVISDSLWTHELQHARLPCPFTVSWSLLKLVPIKSVMPSNHLILCRPLLLLPSIFPSIRFSSNELTLLLRWPKYWSSASVFLMNIQSWFPLRLTGWISLLLKQGGVFLRFPHTDSALKLEF